MIRREMKVITPEKSDVALGFAFVVSNEATHQRHSKRSYRCSTRKLRRTPGNQGGFRITNAPENSVQCETREEWRVWLAKNHERDEGVWLVTFKKASHRPSVEYDASVEEALCFGWVDSRTRALDEDRSMLWFAPRRKGSRWSRSNKDRVARLTKARLMMPPGIAKVEAAKRDGTWNALDAIERLEIPPDLADSFADYQGSSRNFEAFPRWVKRATLEWISTAKRPATRKRRVIETARLAQNNERPKQFRSN